MEKKTLYYHIFLFLSSFTRGLIEVFSLVLLYQKGYSVENIFFFLFLLYFVGIFVNIFSLLLDYRLVLLISVFLYGGSFFYLSVMKNTYLSLIIFSILLSISNYSYHSIRHYLAFSMLDSNRLKTNHLVLLMYLGSIFSSFVGTFLVGKLPVTIIGMIILGFSLLGIYPVLKSKNLKRKEKRQSIWLVKLEKEKIFFSIFEQFKVMFLEIQPLFLYLYVKKSIYYVGIFNVILNFASLIVMYFLSSRLKKNAFKYVCFFLCLFCFLKINIRNGIFLLGLAFFEGVCVKIYENFSLDNLYDTLNQDVCSYLIVEEIIFFGTKSLFMGMVCLFHLQIYFVLLICILGIFCSSFFIHLKKAS